ASPAWTGSSREIACAKVFCVTGNFCTGTGKDFFERMAAHRTSESDSEIGGLLPNLDRGRKRDRDQRSEVTGQRFLQCLPSSRNAAQRRSVRPRNRDSVPVSCVDLRARWPTDRRAA